MDPFTLQLIFLVVVAIVSYALTPKPKNADPAIIQDSDIPIAAEGTPIPVVFGEVWLKQPNVVWYGDLKTTPIHRSGGK